MALCGKIVDLVGTYFRHDLKNRHGVTEVSIVEMEVGFSFKMSDAFAEIY